MGGDAVSVPQTVAKPERTASNTDAPQGKSGGRHLAYTEAEKAEIRRLYADGVPGVEIAKRLNRPARPLRFWIRADKARRKEEAEAAERAKRYAPIKTIPYRSDCIPPPTREQLMSRRG